MVKDWIRLLGKELLTKRVIYVKKISLNDFNKLVSMGFAVIFEKEKLK